VSVALTSISVAVVLDDEAYELSEIKGER
jgi:hypothetical protein